MNWGVKVLRYEIKDITPPNAILHAMQQQITAEREKRALIASSEGRKQEQINIATGAREAEIARSEGEKQAQINIAQGEAGAVIAVAEATARAIQMVAETIRQPGGLEAVNLRVADRFVDAFEQPGEDQQHADRAVERGRYLHASRFGAYSSEGAAGAEVRHFSDSA